MSTDLGRVVGSFFRFGTSVPLGVQFNDLDVYLHTTTGDLYQKLAGLWTLLGNITGAVGPAGTQFTADSGAPSGGSDGDLYLDTDTGDIYQKVLGVWGVICNITGPAGVNGSNGTNGAAWYSGAGSPAPGLGVTGDWYLNTLNGLVSRKLAGTWSIQMNITGPSGANGSTVTFDVDFPVSPANNDLYIQEFTGRQYRYDSGGPSWIEGFPIRELSRYCLPTGGADLSGPGWLSQWNSNGGTAGDAPGDFGSQLTFNTNTSEIGIRNACGIWTSGVLEFQVMIQFGVISGTGILWAGLTADWPDTTYSGGNSLLGVRFHAPNGDTTFTIVANEYLGQCAEDVTSVTPVIDTVYLFHFRYDQPNAILYWWILDDSFATLDSGSISQPPGDWLGNHEAVKMTVNLNDTAATSTVGIIKLSSNR